MKFDQSYKKNGDLANAYLTDPWGTRIELTEGLKEEIGTPKDGEGRIVTLDPIQVVGKRCAESDKMIAYEPDARVCPRCERIYHKAHVPEECACGENLTALRAKLKASDVAKEDDAS